MLDRYRRSSSSSSNVLPYEDANFPMTPPSECGSCVVMCDVSRRGIE